MKTFVYLEFDRYDGFNSKKKIINTDESLKRALFLQMKKLWKGCDKEDLDVLWEEITVGKGVACWDDEEVSYLMIDTTQKKSS